MPRLTPTGDTACVFPDCARISRGNSDCRRLCHIPRLPWRPVRHPGWLLHSTPMGFRRVASPAARREPEGTPHANSLPHTWTPGVPRSATWAGALLNTDGGHGLRLPRSSAELPRDPRSQTLLPPPWTPGVPRWATWAVNTLHRHWPVVWCGLQYRSRCAGFASSSPVLPKDPRIASDPTSTTTPCPASPPLDHRAGCVSAIARSFRFRAPRRDPIDVPVRALATPPACLNPGAVLTWPLLPGGRCDRFEVAVELPRGTRPRGMFNRCVAGLAAEAARSAPRSRARTISRSTG